MCVTAHICIHTIHTARQRASGCAAGGGGVGELPRRRCRAEGAGAGGLGFPFWGFQFGTYSALVISPLPEGSHIASSAHMDSTGDSTQRHGHVAVRCGKGRGGS